MPTKKTVTRTEYDIEGEENPNPENAPFDVDAPDDSEVLNVVRAKFGPAAVKFKVYKSGDKGNAYCYSSTDDFDEDYTQNTYGGGRYVVKVFVNNQYRESHEVLIQEKRAQFQQPNPEWQPRTEGSAAAAEVRMLREQLQFVSNLALNKSNQPIGDLVEAMKAVHQISAPAVESGNDFTKFIEMFRLAREMGGGDSGGDWKVELLKTAKEVAAPLVMQLAKGAVAQPSAVNVPVPPPAMEENMIPPDMVLKQGIEFLKSKVLGGMPFELVVDWVAHNNADPMYQNFIRAVLEQDFETFARIDPAIMNPPFRVWFEGLHAGLREQFTNEATSGMEDDSAGAARDNRNPPDNGRTRKTGSK